MNRSRNLDPLTEEATPLTELGIEPIDEPEKRRSRLYVTDNSTNPIFFRSLTFWAIISIVIITALFFFTSLYRAKSEENKGGQSLVWGIIFIFIIIVVYRSQTIIKDNEKRLALTWAFIINIGLIGLWSLLRYKENNRKAVWILLVIMLIMAAWWYILLSEIDYSSGLILLYIIWLLYLIITGN